MEDAKLAEKFEKAQRRIDRIRRKERRRIDELARLLATQTLITEIVRMRTTRLPTGSDERQSWESWLGVDHPE